MVRNLIFLMISLLCSPVVLYSMEIKNWGYKERDQGYMNYFLPSNPRKFPYFKDEIASDHSFLDELLFATRMESVLTKDVTDIVLHYSYETEKKFGETTNIKLFSNLGLRINGTFKDDTFYLPMKSKRALSFLMEIEKPNEPIVIEGRDKEFAQKMSQYILELPLPIRRKIVGRYGANMVCNSNYEPSISNTLLGEDNHAYMRHKDYFARTTQLATKGTITMLTWYLCMPTIFSCSAENAPMVGGLVALTAGSMMAFLESHNVPEQINGSNLTRDAQASRRVTAAVNRDVPVVIAASVIGTLAGNISSQAGCKTVATSVSGLFAGSVMTESAGMWVYHKTMDYFEESSEDRSRRLGFEIKPLLQENEKW
jgi:hypothetical protein